MAEDDRCADTLAYAAEQGYGEFIAAEQNTYKDGATYTFATFVSGVEGSRLRHPPRGREDRLRARPL